MKIWFYKKITLYFYKIIIMGKVYQPEVIKCTDEIILGMQEMGIFEECEIDSTDFAREYFLEKFTQKFIDGQFNDGVVTITDEEFEQSVKEVITGSLMTELKKKGLVDIIYDEEKNEDIYFLTETGKQVANESKNLDEI